MTTREPPSDPPAGGDDEVLAVTMETVRATQARLRDAGIAAPSVDDVAAALGCHPGAVLGVLAATSGERLEDGSGGLLAARD